MVSDAEKSRNERDHDHDYDRDCRRVRRRRSDGYVNRRRRWDNGRVGQRTDDNRRSRREEHRDHDNLKGDHHSRARD
jgi:hypothetical protein